MNKIFCMCLLSNFLLLGSCINPKKTFCGKSDMNNHKFISLPENPQAGKYFIIIKDTIHLEYAGDSLYAESLVRWNSCYDYNLIVKRTYYKDGLFRPGDTLSVKIKSINNDTLSCIM